MTNINYTFDTPMSTTDLAWRMGYVSAIESNYKHPLRMLVENKPWVSRAKAYGLQVTNKETLVLSKSGHTIATINQPLHLNTVDMIIKARR